MRRPLDQETAAATAERLKVLAQPQRLLILSALADQEMAVSEIHASTGIGQPALSQQLAALRHAKLVAQRREAKQVLYRLTDERTAAVVRFISTVFGSDGVALPASRMLQPSGSITRAVQSAAIFAVVER